MAAQHLPVDFGALLRQEKAAVRKDTREAVRPGAPLLLAGHNIFVFDVPLLATVYDRHGHGAHLSPLALARSAPTRWPCTDFYAEMRAAGVIGAIDTLVLARDAVGAKC